MMVSYGEVCIGVACVKREARVRWGRLGGDKKRLALVLAKLRECRDLIREVG